MAPPGMFAATNPMHMIVRQLFYRLVFTLKFESFLCMEMISFWLWLEAIGHADFLASVDALDNYHLQSIAMAAKTFVETLRQSSHSTHGSTTQGGYFQQEAVKGIVFYLNNVCFKVLVDMRELAEAKEDTYRLRFTNQQAQQQDRKGKAPMSTKDLLSKIKASYTSTSSHEAGSSSRSQPSPRPLILRDIESPIEQCLSTTYPLATLFESLNIREEESTNAKLLQIQIQHSRVPRDERTLFVTFSNGYPFTADELYEFFIGNFGDVEIITVQESVDPKPPLFAHITFYTQETLFRILGRHRTAKFVIRGKHLWARKFIPKRKKFQKN
ncbi:hypothetical protein HU200_015606 [Digitaria exilis]|uniref:RRM domain-containing protein n=1 Tax=Digitaria exilis TaxID=1010633 RepID=A0A835F821_9POAL|nr:hypothetical protein HU200_015606 [Digitaria exilis]